MPQQKPGVRHDRRLACQAVETEPIGAHISLPMTRSVKCIRQLWAQHLNSTRPSFMPRIAGTTFVTIVPSLAFGMSPRGPSTCTLTLGLLSLVCGRAEIADNMHTGTSRVSYTGVSGLSLGVVNGTGRSRWHNYRA